MPERTAHYAALHMLTELYGPQIDAAYRRRIRRQCSREDFAEGYVNGLIDTMPIGQAHQPTQEEADALSRTTTDAGHLGRPAGPIGHLADHQATPD